MWITSSARPSREANSSLFDRRTCKEHAIERACRRYPRDVGRDTIYDCRLSGDRLVLELGFGLLILRDPSAKHLQIEFVLHCRPGDQDADLQTKLV